MGTELPEYYFRVRENGAMVFRVAPENRMRRVEMEQIAVVNINSGEVKPHKSMTLSEADQTAIDSWVSERRSLLAERALDEMRRTVDQLNLATHWAQSRATNVELEALTDDLLMAMHDLRSVLVRKKADRLGD